MPGKPARFSPALAGACTSAFDDPPALAAGAASEEEALDQYRAVRDAIRDFVLGLPDTLETPAQPGDTA